LKGYEEPSKEYLDKDFETCVLEKDPECTYISGTDTEDYPGDHRSQILQFCGHDPQCRIFNNPVALAMAKENVEKFYPVVGITENMNMTLDVMDKIMPEYFEGAKETYYAEKEVERMQFRNKEKPVISEKIKDLVRANFTLELEFYQFLKQRLQTQFDELSAKLLMP